jgi:hypothetical protein
MFRLLSANSAPVVKSSRLLETQCILEADLYYVHRYITIPIVFYPQVCVTVHSCQAHIQMPLKLTLIQSRYVSTRCDVRWIRNAAGVEDVWFLRCRARGQYFISSPSQYVHLPGIVDSDAFTIFHAHHR